jgi:hypothetical protein
MEIKVKEYIDSNKNTTNPKLTIPDWGAG